MKYNIILKDNNDFIKTDKELQKSYNWSKLPKYEIIEKVEEVYEWKQKNYLSVL